jgi:hypothetical protein
MSTFYLHAGQMKHSFWIITVAAGCGFATFNRVPFAESPVFVHPCEVAAPSVIVNNTEHLSYLDAEL